MTEPNAAPEQQVDVPFQEVRVAGEPRPAGVQIKFPALDGFEIGGTLFEISGDSDPTTAVVFAGGGGIAAYKYRHFASYLAAAGIPVLTFDFRGIGISRPRGLRGFSASVEDWSEFDCGGAIDWLRARYPRAELVGVAHSISTLIIGGAPTIGELGRLVFIGAHTGYYGDYLPRHRLPMWFLWHVVMPTLTHAFGYFPAKRLGLGEDIPAGVALQWAARRTPELRPEATNSIPSRVHGMLARYAEIHLPTLVVSFSDDAFATPAAARRLVACYPGIEARYELIEPAGAGLSRIGHFGFFRRDPGIKLWPLVLSYLNSVPTGTAAAAK